MKGYYTNDAIVVATESRTSSPVRIPRDAETLTHPQIKNLYPCGEGAGYAGGIVSAAMDGQKIANIIAEKILQIALKRSSLSLALGLPFFDINKLSCINLLLLNDFNSADKFKDISLEIKLGLPPFTQAVYQKSESIFADATN